MSLKSYTKGSELPPLEDGKLRLFSMRFCPFAQRTSLALIHRKIPFETINVDLKNKPDWFLERNPLGLVPVLEHDGKVVYESIICNDYIDEIYPQEKLNPEDSYQRARDTILLEMFGKCIGPYYAAAKSKGSDQDLLNKFYKTQELFEKTIAERGDFFGDDAERDSDSNQNGGPSSRPANSHVRLSRNEGRKRRRELSTSSSESGSSDSSSDSTSESETDSEVEDARPRRTVRSVVSETISSVTEYERFNPVVKRLTNSILSESQLSYAKTQFSTFIKDDVIEKNILETAPIPDDPQFKSKQLDEYVAPIMDKLNVYLDKGAEKGVLGIQKKIFRTMGPLSRLWQIIDGIREKSRETSQVDEVDIAHMCQLIEKTVCCVGQSSLAVERHRRVNTLMKLTDDYKKAKDLLDKNEPVLQNSGECLFGDGFKKVLKKSSKTLDEASEIANGLKKDRKPKKGGKFKRRKFKHSTSSNWSSNYNGNRGRGGHYSQHNIPDSYRDYETPFQNGPSAHNRGAEGHRRGGNRGGYRGSHNGRQHQNSRR